MLFRDFNMIAAVAYAAQCTADNTVADFAEKTGVEVQRPERLLWTELEESSQNLFMNSALAVARGEPTTIGAVFEATAKAIFDFNDGQGLLALEELMNLGSAVMSLELLQEEDVAGTNIRESIVQLLHELAERRQQPTGATGIAGGALWSSPRFRALEYAARLDGSVETAEVFAKFLTNADGLVCDEALNVLDKAFDAARNKFGNLIAGPGVAEQIVNLAVSYHVYINQPDPIAANAPDELTQSVNGEAELATEQAETIQ